jgi:hypothetical protein
MSTFDFVSSSDKCPYNNRLYIKQFWKIHCIDDTFVNFSKTQDSIIVDIERAPEVVPLCFVFRVFVPGDLFLELCPDAFLLD